MPVDNVHPQRFAPSIGNFEKDAYTHYGPVRNGGVRARVDAPVRNRTILRVHVSFQMSWQTGPFLAICTEKFCNCAEVS